MTKLITISGFLGAGKTTAIAALASHYQDQGKTVAVITNDQGSDLVDTQYLRSLGINTEEIPGGCFCCNFETMKQTALNIHDKWAPDILLAEAVGSCTDLYATVVKPLAANYKSAFIGSPLVTMADPRRILDVFTESDNVFPSEVDYLFKKQLEEAQLLVLTKSDLYNKESIEEAKRRLKDNGIEAPLIVISSKEDHGIKTLATRLIESDYQEKKVIELDYPTYTLAEKHLGWFNMATELKSEDTFSFNEFARDFVAEIRTSMTDSNDEIAHLKLFAKNGKDFSKISLTANGAIADFNKSMGSQWSSYEVIINARINSHPDTIKSQINDTLSLLQAKYGYTTTVKNLEFFQPGDPDPEARVKNMAM